MQLTELTAAERHRAIAGTFSAVAGEIVEWNAPTPVDGWTARDVVGHLTGWSSEFLASGGVTLPAGPDPAKEPVAAWAAHVDAIADLLDGPDAANIFEHPQVPPGSLADTIDRFYTADVFMHTWDLARAGNIPVALDPEFCRRLVDGMTAIEDLLRSSGQYGPAVEVSADADPQTRLVAFIGRNPEWTPPR